MAGSSGYLLFSQCVQELELPDMLDTLEPKSGSASSLPAPLLVELEEIEGIGGPTHIQGVSLFSQFRQDMNKASIAIALPEQWSLGHVAVLDVPLSIPKFCLANTMLVRVRHLKLQHHRIA